MKMLRDAGYTQIYVLLSLMAGYLVTAFHTYSLSGFYIGLVFLVLIFMCIKDTMANWNKLTQKMNFREVALPVVIFYGAIFAVAFFVFLIGIFCGI